MTYNKLLKKANRLGIDVRECKLPKTIKGLFCRFNDQPIIGLNCENYNEKICVLAEELGHFYTSSGDLLANDSVDHVIVHKQEKLARRWAYAEVLTFNRLLAAKKAGCRNLYEVSQFLDVTQGFLIDALKDYQNRYGTYVIHKGYKIHFDPFNIEKFKKRKGVEYYEN